MNKRSQGLIIFLKSNLYDILCVGAFRYSRSIHFSDYKFSESFLFLFCESLLFLANETTYVKRKHEMKT